MKTVLTFSGVAKLSMQARDQGKIYMIKCIREAFGTGLQDSKKIADPLWDRVAGVVIDLPRVTVTGYELLQKIGVGVQQPSKTIPLPVRLMQVIKAALKAEAPLLAADLLQAYNMHAARTDGRYENMPED
jgi:hypothetical protein